MGKIAFTGVQVLDASGGQPFAGEVLVEGNRIRAVARDGAQVNREGARIVDGGGATLMPGLIESHMHCSFLDTDSLEALGFVPVEEHTLRAMQNAKKFLDQGFTAGCSAAAAKPRLDIVIRNAINAGDIPGPRMLACTPELTVSSGLGDVRLAHMHRDTFALICDGADEFRKVSRELVREGVDTLKINPSGDEFVPFARAHHTVMTEDEVAAVCEVARSRGLRTAGHCRSAESVKMCLRQGAEIIYHATLVDEEAKDMLEAEKDRIFVSPTLGVTYTTLYEAGDWGVTTEMATDMGLKRELETAVENMKDLKKRGVRILPGGDYGFAWNPIGNNARDIEYFVNLLDFSPMEAIMAATKGGSEIMMMENELGQIKEGFLADILLVDGNPLTDVSILQDANRLIGIMKDGGFHKDPADHLSASQEAAE
ncbi:MAG: amidohydrolase family protein [Rhodospirillaceae bacterium]|jgi:imidazolonepropionase-like amidohydrolase|nr:amidohydrolase family protein [Rhodospirillaceae bacterium]MBT3494615.1 amidohydrolase family protein [Rhodospirillaceae bacterium]MBT3780895.1 amidohydrolase family protein [Rhodospirillaceae bacterium]MBT3978904.1 amidohydrolase family protein [Rhodospirillaceae bacterium]MBT4170835.1 amidohydrolase family protein [Rhodospirillaceae bacterium]